MIEPRIYRAALLPALLAVLVAMFSVESRPPALGRGLAADQLFDSARTLGEARRLADQARGGPGSAGATEEARTVAESLATSGFESRIDRFEGGGRRLANVLGSRSGTSAGKGQIVLVAERDAAGRGGAASSAADTAALLELGRALEGRPSKRTITLVSLDGGRFDEAGARRLAESLDPRRVEAVIAVSNLGAPGELESTVVPWSSDPTRPSPRLQRTAGDAVRQELGRLPGQESMPGQLLRLAFPLGLGAQGVMLEHGIQSIRFAGSGELPPRDEDLARIDGGRYSAMGRAVLRTISALDGRGIPPGEAPGTYLLGKRQVVPGWSVALVAIALLLPALVTVADGFARAGRRAGGVGAWTLWTLVGALPFAAAYALLRLLDLIGLVPGMGVAAAPSSEPLTAWSVVLLGALALATAAGWFLGRRAIVRRLGLSRPSAPGAGAAVALVVCVVVLALWALDPLAALFLVPAVHLWSGAAVSSRPRLGLVSAMAGLVLPLAAAIFYLDRLSLDPLAGLWYGSLLAAGGHVSTATTLLVCVLVGAFWSLVAVLAARATQQASAPPPTALRHGPRLRGPRTYAGPGSLGGTPSTLRR